MGYTTGHTMRTRSNQSSVSTSEGLQGLRQSPEEKFASLAGAVTGEGVVQVYRTPGLSESGRRTLLGKAQSKVSAAITDIEAELCFNVSTTGALSSSQAATLSWLLKETYEPELLTAESSLGGGSNTSEAFFPSAPSHEVVVEVGPRMNFSTAWAANALSICQSCGLDTIDRIELSRRYLLSSSRALTEAECDAFAALVHDRMTEQRYLAPLKSFATDTVPAKVEVIDIMNGGREALSKVNDEMGFAFDEWDLDYYTNMFKYELRTNPTNVE